MNRFYCIYRFCGYSPLRALLRARKFDGAQIFAAAVMLCLPLMTGCADVPSLNRAGEVVNQLGHAVDVAQTLHATSEHCYQESDPITSRIIGRAPSHAAVIGWGVGYAAVHYGIYRLLADSGHDYLAAAWELVTLETTARTVANNISVGVRLGGKNLDTGCAARGDVLLHVGERH